MVDSVFVIMVYNVNVLDSVVVHSQHSASLSPSAIKVNCSNALEFVSEIKVRFCTNYVKLCVD